MRSPNYDKYPATRTEGALFHSWDAIREALGRERKGPLAVDWYAGVHEAEITEGLLPGFSRIIRMRDLMKPEAEIRRMTDPFMTDDVLFGYVTNLRMPDFFDAEKLAAVRTELETAGEDVLILGAGAALVAPQHAVLAYADMARWEIQQRFRRHEVCGLGVDNREDPVSIQYKRGLFIDWRVLDYYKDTLFARVDWWIDTNAAGDPKMISRETFFRGIDKTARKPFRVVPFFDPAPWGGQWMKDVCDLDREVPNFGWCFDCVPEENSLLLEVEGVKFELPSNDLILLRAREVLGAPVEARFGKDFPIRFDFLDTMGGGNLSLQVHPTTQFIREQFGMPYTQDESYYLLDAQPDAVVYLGLKKGVDRVQMIEDLRAAQRGELVFDAEKYVNKIPAKKHDHYLIPGGTIHCSGAGSMVLEISSTPNIFTFKLWDWGRLGLDGKPRPINVERGRHVIQWERDTDYVKAHLANHFSDVAEGEGWKEIKTGLHPNEFIETRRTSFSVPVTFRTENSVHVLNLVEGEEAVVESPDGRFEPFVVHYAETFIIPASVEEYTVRPSGLSEGKTCMTIRASVRFNA
ncbi:MAG: class I mannose-6-phosphate isomerase [Bacteroidales bacterium]|nr:class I mannose-6-phosphate isomerase [Bacteroidales bacterium]